MRTISAVVATAGIAVIVAACGTRPAEEPSASPAAEPAVVYEPLSKAGNTSPYRVAGRRYFVLPRSEGYLQTGVASWYGKEFHGKPTSNQESFDMYAYSAAHRTLPLPSYVRVTNLENGRDVTVRVNDRGPFKDGRIIDLSYAAARKIGMIEAGTATVEVRALSPAGDEQRPDVAHADRIYLQVGAFAERDNALALLKRLRSDHIELGFVRTSEGPAGRPLHRVRIGPLQDERSAEALAAQVERLGIRRATLVFE